jgi:hypothetical protein
MRKLVIFTMLLIICLSSISSADFDSKTLELSTDIAPYAIFKIFNASGNAATKEVIIPGEQLQLNYSCISNQYLKLVVDSANTRRESMRLNHDNISTNPTWFIPYTISMDLGYSSGTEIIKDEVIYKLYNVGGVYNLDHLKLHFDAPSNENNIYAAGHYTDTVTFTISAP